MYKYPYQKEYQLSKELLWKPEPAKFVKVLLQLFPNEVKGKWVLDLGAGEGKNSIPFAKYNCKVIAIDKSEIALSRFIKQPLYELCKDNILRVNIDVRDVNFQENSFNIIVAYGIFHCLNSISEINNIVKRVKNWITKKGYFVGATFTNDRKPPDEQDYLNYNAFLEPQEFKRMFNGWEIIQYEEQIIKETHPIEGSIEHEHSIARIIARKP